MSKAALTAPSDVYDALITSIGTASFGPTLLAIADAQVGVDEIYAYCAEASARPQTLASVGTRGARSRRVSLYLDHFYGMDPVLARIGQGDNGIIAYRISADDIDDADYRRECFDNPRFSEKWSFTRVRGHLRFVLSFYRRSDRPRLPIEALSSLVELAMPALAKHLTLCDSAGTELVTRLTSRLAISYPELTERERGVCARTLAGMTAEAIALDMDVRPSTVITYRRRAYERFGYSNANNFLERLLS